MLRLANVKNWFRHVLNPNSMQFHVTEIALGFGNENEDELKQWLNVHHTQSQRQARLQDGTRNQTRSRRHWKVDDRSLLVLASANLHWTWRKKSKEIPTLFINAVAPRGVCYACKTLHAVITLKGHFYTVADASFSAMRCWIGLLSKWREKSSKGKYTGHETERESRVPVESCPSLQYGQWSFSLWCEQWV